MERPPTRFLLAEAGRLVGYSAMTVDFSTWSGKHYGHMDCLFVAEEMRGLGIGRSLFDATLKAAQRMGLEHLEWQTPAWNSRASDFYTRQGAMFSEKLRFRIGL